MNRSISLSEHHARRRKAQALRDRDEYSASSHETSCSTTSSSSSSRGVAHDAACLGAYEGHSRLVSSTRRHKKGIDTEHASYTAESCLVENRGGIVSPPHIPYSSPDLDMEDHYSSVSRVRGRYDDCSSGRGSSFSRLGSSSGYGTRSSVTSEDSFVSVDVSGSGGGGFDGSTIATDSILAGEGGGGGLIPSGVDDDDAIRAGIVDISVFVATYLAGVLSFVIGIFLALLSPIIKLIKVIFGDLTGLIGDAFGLALRNNPGLSRDLQGLTRILKRFSSKRRPDDSYSSQYDDDCEASIGSSQRTESQSYYENRSFNTDATTAEPLYVGGWSPSISSSRGSSRSYPSNGSSSGRHNGGSRSRSSKSYSSLPQVNEDDVSSCPSYSYYPDDATVGTSRSFERDSSRLMQRAGGMRGSRRGFH